MRLNQSRGEETEEERGEVNDMMWYDMIKWKQEGIETSHEIDRRRGRNK